MKKKNMNSVTNKIIVSIVALTILLPITTLAAEEQKTDVGFSGSGVYLSVSEDQLFVGDTIRIYGRLRNYGTTDVTGSVGFYIGDELLEVSQQISLPQNGLDEEVFVDFIVPGGTFNISGRVENADPMDQNTDNNYAQTTLLTPVYDNDKDGIVNDSDNCKEKQNQDQKDTDGDGIGDACDIDDDNDGLNDGVEKELGTDPTNKDTDKDGIEDASDRDPLNYDKAPEPKQPEQEEEKQTRTDQPQQQSENTKTKDPSILGKIFKLDASSDDIKEPKFKKEPLKISHKAIFTAEKLAWNNYTFQTTQSDIENLTIEWDLGDKQKSDQPTVNHIYRSAGEYTVRLQVTDEDGNIEEDSINISISFFHLTNPVFLSFVVVLAILVLLTIAALFRLKGDRYYEEDDE